MAGAATVSALVLAAVFAWAAVAKAVQHRATLAAFTGLGLPAPAALAVVVPLAEIAVAALLVVRPDVGAALALGALAAFTLVVILAIGRGSQAGCGCFGARRIDPVSPADVVRNGLLAGFAAVATGASRPVRPGPAAVAGMVVAVALAAAIQRLAERRLA